MSKTKTIEEAQYMTTFDTPFYSLARQINDDPDGVAGCRLDLYMNGHVTIYGSDPGNLMTNVINHYVACISINESVVNDIVDVIMSDIARTANQLIGDNSNAKDLSAGDTLGTISYNVHNFSYNKKNGECECLLTITFGAKDHPAAVEFSRAIKWKNEGELTHRVPEVIGTLTGLSTSIVVSSGASSPPSDGWLTSRSTSSRALRYILLSSTKVDTSNNWAIHR